MEYSASERYWVLSVTKVRSWSTGDLSQKVELSEPSSCPDHRVVSKSWVVWTVQLSGPSSWAQGSCDNVILLSTAESGGGFCYRNWTRHGATFYLSYSVFSWGGCLCLGRLLSGQLCWVGGVAESKLTGYLCYRYYNIQRPVWLGLLVLPYDLTNVTKPHSHKHDQETIV